MNRQSCWRCVLEIEYRYNNIRIAYSLILQSTTPYTPCSVLVHRPSFNGGVWWRRQSCSGSIDGFLPTAVHNTVHYVHYNWVCRVQSLFGFIDHIWSLSYGVLILWYWMKIFFIRCTSFGSVLCTLYSVHYPMHIRILKWGVMLCIYASGHSAIGEQCSPQT